MYSTCTMIMGGGAAGEPFLEDIKAENKNELDIIN
jgi:hypothetical protein